MNHLTQEIQVFLKKMNKAKCDNDVTCNSMLSRVTVSDREIELVIDVRQLAFSPLSLSFMNAIA